MTKPTDPQELSVHGVLSWRADSKLLARLRPVFAALLADAATVECERGEVCRTSAGGSRDLWCAACRLHDIAEWVQRVAGRDA